MDNGVIAIVPTPRRIIRHKWWWLLAGVLLLFLWHQWRSGFFLPEMKLIKRIPGYDCYNVFDFCASGLLLRSVSSPGPTPGVAVYDWGGHLVAEHKLPFTISAIFSPSGELTALLGRQPASYRLQVFRAKHLLWQTDIPYKVMEPAHRYSLLLDEQSQVLIYDEDPGVPLPIMYLVNGRRTNTSLSHVYDTMKQKYEEAPGRRGVPNLVNGISGIYSPDKQYYVDRITTFPPWKIAKHLAYLENHILKASLGNTWYFLFDPSKKRVAKFGLQNHNFSGTRRECINKPDGTRLWFYESGLISPDGKFVWLAFSGKKPENSYWYVYQR